MKHVDKDKLHHWYITEKRSTTWIAKKLGLTNHQTVVGLLWRNNIPHRPPKRGRYDLSKDVIVNLYERGNSTREIGKILDVPHKTIWYRLKQWKVPLRNWKNHKG